MPLGWCSGHLIPTSSQRQALVRSQMPIAMKDGGKGGKLGIAGNSYFNKWGKSKSTKGAAACCGGLLQEFTMRRGLWVKKSVAMGGTFEESTMLYSRTDYQ